MRRAAILAVIALASLSAIARADDPIPVFSQPMNEQLLNRLDAQQLVALRRAMRMCQGARIRAERNPCVTTTTDRAIAATGDADLQKFHASLRPQDRYDEDRTSNVWRVWLTDESKMHQINQTTH